MDEDAALVGVGGKKNFKIIFEVGFKWIKNERVDLKSKLVKSFTYFIFCLHKTRVQK